MVRSTPVSGKITKNMDKGSKSGPMAEDTLDDLRTIICTEKASTSGQTTVGSTACSEMACNMAKGSWSKQMGMRYMASGYRTRVT